MDEMSIASEFTTRLISKLIIKFLNKKFGYDVNIQINEVKVTIVDGKSHIHLNVDGEIDPAELMKILKV